MGHVFSSLSAHTRALTMDKQRLAVSFHAHGPESRACSTWCAWLRCCIGACASASSATGRSRKPLQHVLPQQHVGNTGPRTITGTQLPSLKDAEARVTGMTGWAPDALKSWCTGKGPL